MQEGRSTILLHDSLVSDKCCLSIQNLVFESYLCKLDIQLNGKLLEHFFSLTFAHLTHLYFFNLSLCGFLLFVAHPLHCKVSQTLTSYCFYLALHSLLHHCVRIDDLHRIAFCRYTDWQEEVHVCKGAFEQRLGHLIISCNDLTSCIMENQIL